MVYVGGVLVAVGGGGLEAILGRFTRENTRRRVEKLSYIG